MRGISNVKETLTPGFWMDFGADSWMESITYDSDRKEVNEKTGDMATPSILLLRWVLSLCEYEYWAVLIRSIEHIRADRIFFIQI